VSRKAAWLSHQAARSEKKKLDNIILRFHARSRLWACARRSSPLRHAHTLGLPVPEHVWRQLIYGVTKSLFIYRIRLEYSDPQLIRISIQIWKTLPFNKKILEGGNRPLWRQTIPGGCIPCHVICDGRPDHRRLRQFTRFAALKGITCLKWHLAAQTILSPKSRRHSAAKLSAFQKKVETATSRKIVACAISTIVSYGLSRLFHAGLQSLPEAA